MAFEEKQAELRELGVSLFAAAVDPEEKVQEIVDGGISFPMGFGVDRATGDALGAWWDERGDFIQPSEFVIRQDGIVLHSTYSASPIGRTDPGDVFSLLSFLEARRKRKAAKSEN